MRIRSLFLLLGLPVMSMAQSKKHVLLVSIDGFRPNFYKDARWKAPLLERLKAEGIYADGVNSVFPSVTYPSHTTIVTGALPAQHGIYYNVPYESKNGAWYWEESAIKVPTLWDAIKKAQLKSGAVMWPVTVGAPIDYNFPVRRADNDEKTDQLSVTKPFITPSGLLGSMQKSMGSLSPKDFNHDNIDVTIGKMASYIVKTHQPDLMAVHFVGLDHAQHDFGRDAAQVQHSLTQIDSMLNIVLNAYKEAGLLNKTDIIITGDHGFVSVRQHLSPNALLREAGLIQENDWKARFVSTGGSAFLYLKDKGDKLSLNKVVALLHSLPADQKKCFKILQRQELDQMGANPEVALALAADNRSAFNGSTDGPFVKPRKKVTGSHGHDPRMPELFTGFIGSGPSFKQGHITKMKLTDISGLIGDILGLSFKEADPDVQHQILKD
ncbi:ectonucleotide pyrophosphatase/phosphodiesterase [Niabella insulamsoli]|uniref:alkaline phosphatase family protein n=1 Tax=Niabella insulamsoli TaxID=3144874 RepID=UPI0031FBEF1C